MTQFSDLPVRRVQVPAYSDRWMMGDRYGELVGMHYVRGTAVARVRMDRSGKVCRFLFSDCTIV